jgi:hypothetical protein
VLTGGPLLDAIWRRLLDRTGPRTGVRLTDDADLHPLVDGVRIDPTSRFGAVRGFRLAARPETIRIVFRAGAPAELGLARDNRVIGVALTRIMLCKGARLRLLEADDPSLTDGFHGFEPADGLRWTDGDAAVPAALFEGFGGVMELLLHLAGSTRYPAFADVAGLADAAARDAA